jgi:hydrogenase 3 maturation protease
VNRPELVPENLDVELRRHLATGKVAVMGVGNTMRCDDGFGQLLVDSLQSAGLPERVRLFPCEMVPENFVGPVTRFQPETVLMIDTAELGERPGGTRLINFRDIADCGMTTHNVSLRLLANMLESATNAEVMLLAVQPEKTGFGTELSPTLLRTLDCLSELLVRVLKSERACKGRR